MPINKVIVITNDEIIETAKEKIVDKLGKPSAQYANVHFLGGKALAQLIDTHWPEFWDASAELLVDEDRISEDAGEILYVLSRAYALSQSESKKRVQRTLSLQRILQQTGLGKIKVQVALEYLVKSEYVEKKSNSYALHSKKTAGKLLVDQNQIRLLFAIRTIANSTLRFTLDDLQEECKSNELLQFSKSYV